MDNLITVIISSVLSASAVAAIAWVVAKRFGQTFLEGALKKYQQHLDRQNIEHEVIFSTKHDKQVNAIHDFYSTYVKLYRQIDRMYNGDKYSILEEDIFTEIDNLLFARKTFLDCFEPNRIIFPISLCEKIDIIIPKTNDFIDTYKGGLMASSREELQEMMEHMDGPNIITGIWVAGSFDKVIADLKAIKIDIEKEFRKLLRTD